MQADREIRAIIRQIVYVKQVVCATAAQIHTIFGFKKGAVFGNHVLRAAAKRVDVEEGVVIAIGAFQRVFFVAVAIPIERVACGEKLTERVACGES